MVRSRQKRRKKRKTGCGRLLFYLVLIAVLGAGVFHGYRLMTAEMAVVAALFMERAQSGNEEGARIFLAGAEPGLPELTAFFRDGAAAYTGVGRSRLAGLSSGRVEILLQAGEHSSSVYLHLVRRDGDWLIYNLPRFKTMEGAFVKGSKAGTLHLFWEGEEVSISAPGLPAPPFGAVASVTVVGDTAVVFDLLAETALSRLVRRGGTELEGEREGILLLKNSPAIYLVEGDGVKMGTPSDLVIGLERPVLFLSGGMVVAARLEQVYVPRTIRVVLRQDLNNLTSESLQHRLLRLSSEGGLTLEDRQSGFSRSFSPGAVLLVEPLAEGIRVTPEDEESLFFHNRIVFYPGAAYAVIIHNLSRAYWGGDPPAYRGPLEVQNRNGRLVVVNEPTLEQYLYTVVPSEMPLSFGAEALKAQAVAARSYAYTSIFSGRFSEYGAHVDDSVMSQVYHNTREYPLSTAAVEATAGLVLFHGEAVADTRFFSTSSGYTANYHEVWHDPASGIFPPAPVPYLRAASQVPGESIRLQTEDEVRQFLQRGDWPALDRQAPYFRWRVEMTAAEMEASINQNLGQRFREQPGFILTRQGTEFRSMEIPLNPLGSLLDIRVVQRGAGGNIMILEVEGTNGTYRIIKEYTIRFTLRPVQYLPGGSPVLLHLHDGGRVADSTALPSAFASFELTRNASGNLERVVITGGGYGHGVGMSQHGARGMAGAGYRFAEILEHYYPGTSLRSIYD